jgi:hypothetical protein
MIDEEEITYTISSGNVFADAGLPNPDEYLARSDLLYYIMTEIKRCGLSVRQAALAPGCTAVPHPLDSTGALE